MKKYFFIPLIFVLGGCLSRPAVDKSDSIVSIQIVDRNGFMETISNKDRLSSFQATDFSASQPYQKVLRVYGRNDRGQSTSKITSYHDNGSLNQYLEAVDGRANGLYQEWFPNGKLKVEAHLVEGVADLHDLAQATWVFDGSSTAWDEEGNKAALFSYEKGLLVSQALYFFPDGTIQQRQPYEKGLLHGLCTSFDSSGFLLEEISYKEGIKEGIATAYWQPGKLRYKETYQEGKLIEATYWDKEEKEVASIHNGRGQMAQFEGEHLLSLSSIKEGVVDGEILFFRENGALHCSYTLHEGKKHGQEWEYFPCDLQEKPSPQLCILWEQDQIQGQIKTWYPGGQIESQREIHNNKKHGSSFAWYENGDIMLTEEYDNDLLVKGVYYKKGDKKAVSKVDSGKGAAHLYTKEGLFLKKVAYEKGKPLLSNGSIP